VSDIPTIDNYKTWDNVQAITLTSRNNIGGDKSYSVGTAKRRAPGFKELAPSGGVYTSQDLVWLLPKKLVDAAGATENNAPKPGDVITAESVAWTILECPLNTLKSTYRCMTRDLILAYNLRSLLTVRRRTTSTTTDNAAELVYTYQNLYTNIPCRFQETDARVQDERGKRLTIKTYSVWVDRRLYLSIEDQILDDASNVYELKSWHDADRIDQLQRLECEKRWS
jgi:hypothetical protein